MRKGGKAYLSLALCLILLGSNSAFVYASEAEVQNPEEVVAQVEENLEILEDVPEVETEDPVVSKEMPDVEVLPTAACEITYSAEYNPKAPYETALWMKFIPEKSGVYLLSSNEPDGNKNIFDAEGDPVNTEYTYCERGLLQYLEAGVTYALKLNGVKNGSGVLEFSIAKAKDVASLKVTKAPAKATYYNNFGEDLSAKGMKVRVNYTDGTYETVTVEEFNWIDLKSGYSLCVEAEWRGDFFNIYINNFESVPAITYKVKFADAAGLTKYTSGNKITFAAGETVKYLKFVPGFTGEYVMQAIGMTNIYAYLYDASTGEKADTVTKGKTYHLRVENLAGISGTARVNITKKAQTSAKALKGFEITKQPYQKEFYYKPGKSVELCPAGMEITATYGDGSKEVLKYTHNRNVYNADESLRFSINKISISSPKEGKQTLTISVNDYDFTDSYEVVLKPYPEETDSSLEEGITKLQVEPGKPYYYSYVIPKDGVYDISLSDIDSYQMRNHLVVLGDKSDYWGGTKEFTEGMVVYVYLLNMLSETMEVEINIQRLHDIGATISDFEWTTPPKEEVLAYYGLIRAEGIVTFSDGSKVQAGVPALQQHTVDFIDYPIEIKAEITDGKDSSVVGEREITYTVGVKSGDNNEYVEVDKRTIEFVGPSTYNGGPAVTIKKNQSVNVNAAKIGDDYVAYKFVPAKTAAYRMIGNGEVGYENAHTYGIFVEMDGKVECVDSTNVSGYYVDREILKAGQTYYVVFPVCAKDNFTFTCRENKAVQGVSGYFSNELQVKNATVADVLKNAVITVNFKDGTSEKLDHSKWTYFSNEEKTGYYNMDSYYNVYTVRLGQTQGTTKKLTAARQMITISQEMNYGYTVDLGYVRANGYKITFHKNNGTYLGKASAVIESGKQLGTLPVAKRKGYVLKGWYTAKTGGTKFTATTKISTGRTLYAQWTKVTAPAKVNKPTLTNVSGKKMKVAYKKVTNAKGYQIVYSTSSKFTNSTTKKVTVTTLNKTFSSLKKGKTYYVKVRAYKTDSYGNKVWGAYSAVNKVTIKK